jgi:Uma2 family endonuclease
MSTQAATYLDAIKHLPTGSALIVSDVSWLEYERLLDDLGGHCSVRVSYDRGRLEIVSPSTKHEKCKELVLLLAHVLAEETGTRLESVGSTTFKRAALAQGAEPDTCFYVEHAAAVIGKDDLDLAVDPPPDIVVEIELSHRSPGKLAFYAAIGVPEVWRYDGQRASIHHLSGLEYVDVSASVIFPVLTADELTARLRQLGIDGQQAVLASFRESLRHHLGT